MLIISVAAFFVTTQAARVQDSAESYGSVSMVGGFDRLSKVLSSAH